MDRDDTPPPLAIEMVVSHSFTDRQTSSMLKALPTTWGLINDSRITRLVLANPVNYAADHVGRTHTDVGRGLFM